MSRISIGSPGNYRAMPDCISGRCYPDNPEHFEVL